MTDLLFLAIVCVVALTITLAMLCWGAHPGVDD
jgi:hypothetical protein